eukprot:5493494-Pleurochrysis_carterae.AAC.4
MLCKWGCARLRGVEANPALTRTGHLAWWMEARTPRAVLIGCADVVIIHDANNLDCQNWGGANSCKIFVDSAAYWYAEMLLRKMYTRSEDLGTQVPIVVAVVNASFRM